MRFLTALAGAAIFVWLSSRALPDLVASHFGTTGSANGFMPRLDYRRLMLLLVIGLPLIMAYLPGFGLNRPAARINLPNRKYWLAPARRAETVRILRTGMRRVATLLLIFLSYAHWLVVQANRHQPPSLSMPWFMGGLLLFTLAMLAVAWQFIARFRSIPQ